MSSFPILLLNARIIDESTFKLHPDPHLTIVLDIENLEDLAEIAARWYTREYGTGRYEELDQLIAVGLGELEIPVRDQLDAEMKVLTRAEEIAAERIRKEKERRKRECLKI